MIALHERREGEAASRHFVSTPRWFLGLVGDNNWPEEYCGICHSSGFRSFLGDAHYTTLMQKKFLIAKKVSMSRIFQPDGTAVAVTVLSAEPSVVTQVRTTEKDGYSAVQLGYGTKKRLSKPQAGHLKGLAQARHLREFRLDESNGVERGATMDVQQFAAGDIVHVVGTSKGKGFAGVVKRHGFHGSPASHGHKDQLRMPGSIGSTAPQRVFKGMRMAGHMGDARITVRNLEIMEVRPKTNELLVKGAVPGARNGILLITT